MRVEQLKEGATFRVMGEELELLYRNDTRAYVRPTKRDERTIVTRRGKERTFKVPRKPYSISCGTVIDPPEPPEPRLQFNLADQQEETDNEV